MDELRVDCMSSNTTDALPNKEIQCEMQLSQKNVNLRVLQQVEKELEEYEKISILFLLSAGEAGAYTRIIDLCKNIKDRSDIISEYIQNDVQLWQEKLIEALCIIDNREILRNLGYSPDDLAERYHQDIPSYTVNIHKVSKVLYELFESLNSGKTRELLGYIYKENPALRQSVLHESSYLELHALYWLHIKYITISSDRQNSNFREALILQDCRMLLERCKNCASLLHINYAVHALCLDGGNLSKLLKHVKRLDCCKNSLYCDIERFSTPSSQSDSCNEPRSASLQFPEPPTQDDSQSTSVGRAQYIRKGKCVIVNEVRFPRKYEQREGSNSDRDALRKTFSALGFEILSRENLTKQELVDFVKETSEEFDDSKYDCLVFCILTHGYEGGIVTSDGEETPIANLEDKICTTKLRNIIKLLIVQACQGKTTGDASGISELATDGSNCENVLRFRNFARFMSTMDGFASIRHKIKGSWFIQTLCDALSRQERITISDWTALVIQMVESKTGCVNGCTSATQIPEFKTRLSAQIYFPPYQSNIVTVAQK